MIKDFYDLEPYDTFPYVVEGVVQWVTVISKGKKRGVDPVCALHDHNHGWSLGESRKETVNDLELYGMTTGWGISALNYYKSMETYANNDHYVHGKLQNIAKLNQI